MSDRPTTNGVQDDEHKQQENETKPNRDDNSADCAPTKQGNSKTRKNKERKARLKEWKKQEKTIAIGPDGFPQKAKIDPPVVLSTVDKMRAAESERKRKEELLRVKQSEVDDENFRQWKEGNDVGIEEFLHKNAGMQYKKKRSLQDRLLNKIDESQVFLTMDCYSRRLDKDPNPNAKVMSLYDQGTPDTIIKNILASNILTNAHKIHISRPTPVCPKGLIRPSNFMQVYGLKLSERHLFLGRAKEDFIYLQKVRWVLRRSPHINDLLEDSCLANSVMPYLFKYTTGEGVYPVTATFALYVGSKACSPKYARMMATCALYSIVNNNTEIKMLDVDKLGEDGRALGNFMNVKFDPERSFSFLHQLWKEFYAAMKLMYDCTVKEFAGYIERLKSASWKPILRFAFGLLNPDVHAMINPIYTISSSVIDTKKAMLKDIANSLCSQIKGDPSNSALFSVCGLAYESGCIEIIRSVADQLPRKISLNTQISLKNVADLALVLCATSNIKLHIVGSSYKVETFADECLESLMEMLIFGGYKHQIEEFHMWEEHNFEMAYLIPFIDDMRQLSIIDCDLSDGDMHNISCAVQTREQPIEYLDLSNNKLNTHAVECLASCLHKIVTLKLMCCSLKVDHLWILCKAACNMKNHRLKTLLLDSNMFGDEGAKVLADNMSNVNNISMVRCGVTQVGEQAFLDNNKTVTKSKCSIVDCSICKAEKERIDKDCAICQATLLSKKSATGQEPEKRENAESPKEEKQK